VTYSPQGAQRGNSGGKVELDDRQMTNKGPEKRGKGTSTRGREGVNERLVKELTFKKNVLMPRRRA